MAPKGDFFPWWAKEDTRKGTPVIVTMENVNYSVVEIEGPDSAFRPVDKDRVKNAKQFTWVLILKANRAVGCLAWIGHILWALLGAIKKRLFFRRGVDMESEKAKLLFRLILGLLITAVAFLAFEVIAHYYMRWTYFQQHNLHIIPQTSQIRGLHCLCFWFDNTCSSTSLFEDTRKGTPVIVTMENVNYSVVEIEGPDSAFRPVDKDRVKNAKQFTWVLILKANRAVGCLAWIGHILWALLGAIKKRLFFRRGVDMESEKAKLLFRLILGLLITVVAFLAFEVIPIII
ncbi:hypothetical protein OSB04_004224 [Centaurea solstitialis]|uniref:Uncharacterized protein n=1 Tax=Centaurea solstitialis TaxID=347529 RepID=A0AA38TWE8_9ASTR|nr:hypothetical protein OSB04_004224 [Centaurea solstitialis]